MNQPPKLRLLKFSAKFLQQQKKKQMNSFAFVRLKFVNSGWGEGGVCKKVPATSFSPVTPTNVGISPQKFLAFSFNHFTKLVPRFKTRPNASSKLLKLN